MERNIYIYFSFYPISPLCIDIDIQIHRLAVLGFLSV